MSNLKLKTQFHTLSNKQRLYQLDVPLVGITGGVGSGKSSVSKLFNDLGLHSIDADRLIKEIYQIPKVIKWLDLNGQGVVRDQQIDFKKLRSLFFQNIEFKNELEALLYSYLEEIFLKSVKILNQSFVLYDIPLLFEKKLETKFDQIICVWVDKKTQRSRLEMRDQGLEIDNVIRSQLDLDLKKEKSHFVIDNSSSLTETKKQVQQLASDLFEKS